MLLGPEMQLSEPQRETYCPLGAYSLVTASSVSGSLHTLITSNRDYYLIPERHFTNRKQKFCKVE